MDRDAEGDITNHIVTAKTKSEEKHRTEGQKSPQKKNSIRYRFNFVEKNYNKKSLEGRFQNKYKPRLPERRALSKQIPEK